MGAVLLLDGGAERPRSGSGGCARWVASPDKIRPDCSLLASCLLPAACCLLLTAGALACRSLPLETQSVLTVDLCDTSESRMPLLLLLLLLLVLLLLLLLVLLLLLLLLLLCHAPY